MMHTIEVGKPYPGAVPTSAGATLEIGPDGDLLLMIQMPNPSQQEVAALQAGFERYSFYWPKILPYLCAWIFKFPAPVGYIDAPFHAGLYQSNRGEKWIDYAGAGGNLLTVYILDGQIVRGIRAIGLQNAAREDFLAAVISQDGMLITRQDYESGVESIFSNSPEELFHRGKQYRHAGKA